MRTKPEKHVKFINAKAFCFVLVLIAIVSSTCFGQSITWQRTYDGVDHLSDGSFGVCKADGNNIYVAGYTTFLPNRTYIYVVKLNPFGDTIWSRTMSIGTNGGEVANAIVADNTGNCVITGDAGSPFSIKFDLNGNIIWKKMYGGGFKQCYSIIMTSDGGYIACGRDAGCATDCAYILKIDSNGNLQWQQTYSTLYSKYFYSISETNDFSGYITTGFDYAGATDTAKGYIMKVNHTGTLIWEKNILIEQGTNIKSIIKHNNGYLIGGGSFNSSLNMTRLFFGKLNELGDTSKVKIFETNSNEYFGDFKKINDNKFVIASSKDSTTILNGHIFTIDSLGSIISSKLYMTKDVMHLDYSLPLSNGDIIFGGMVDFDPMQTREDIYVLRTDSMLSAPPPIGINNLNKIIPDNFRLRQNYPNPFNPSTTIEYDVFKNSNIKLILFNSNGRIIGILENSIKSPGLYRYELNAARLNLASGIYFVKLESDNSFNQSLKIILIK
ncbi:MAG: T9SS type A sorting domain-containing protein [Ignavibacteria bacterium]|nr:T9SS type A sorting domain-containing protein [Ignavibacteria bacterium]